MFIDEDFARANNIPLKLKNKPETLTVVDGRTSSAGDIIYEAEIQLQLDQHIETAIFQVTKISGYPAILGRSWLSYHSPDINWAKGTITFSSPICQISCLPTRSQLQAQPLVAKVSAEAIQLYAVRP